jgi:hypothetical protein
MPSDFRTIRSSLFDLPTNGDIDITIEFPAPGVDSERRAILMFRAHLLVTGPFGVGPARIAATLNGKELFEQTISDTADRSFHHILDSKIVKPTDNALTLIRNSGSGTARLSDLVLIYAI